MNIITVHVMNAVLPVWPKATAVIALALQLMFRKHYPSEDNVFSIFHFCPSARSARALEGKVYF